MATMETIGRMRNKKERKEEKMERWRRKKLGAQVPLQYFLKKKEKVPLQYFAASAIA